MPPATRWRLLDVSSQDDQLNTLKQEVYTRSYDRGPLLKCHAGSVCWVGQRFGPPAVVVLESLLKQVQGSAGALSYLRGELDIAFFVAHSPPRLGLAAKPLQWVYTVNEMPNGINSAPLASPTCRAPSIRADLA
eukprot:3348425-Pyramimonas_sp.AAC.1